MTVKVDGVWVGRVSPDFSQGRNQPGSRYFFLSILQMEKTRLGKFSKVVLLESGRGLNQLWKVTLGAPCLGSEDKTRDVQLFLTWSRVPRGGEESPPNAHPSEVPRAKPPLTRLPVWSQVTLGLEPSPASRGRLLGALPDFCDPWISHP